MKVWIKLVASTAVLVSFSINAQNADQRKSVRESIAATELGALADKYQLQFEADEAGVRQYLLDHPTVQREEIINGKTHFIVRIDADGSPVLRVARDIGLKNRESGQLI